MVMPLHMADRQAMCADFAYSVYTHCDVNCPAHSSFQSVVVGTDLCVSTSTPSYVYSMIHVVHTLCGRKCQPPCTEAHLSQADA